MHEQTDRHHDFLYTFSPLLYGGVCAKNPYYKVVNVSTKMSSPQCLDDMMLLLFWP